MNLPQLLERLRTRRAVIAIVAVLLVLNLGRLVMDHLDQRQEEVATRIGLLEQYQKSIRKLAATRVRVAGLKKQKEQLDSYLVAGKTAEEIESMLQIKLQEQITAAGLQVESLRPVKQAVEPRAREKGKEKDRGYGEITIKIRLSGTLNQFLDFVSRLYQAKNLYKLDGLTLMPFKDKQLKIYFDYQGYYRITT